MLLPIRFALPVAIVLTLSACGKVDLSSLIPDKNTSSQIPATTPAQTTRADDLQAIFAAPQWGDVYAAELTYFSADEFGMDGKAAFGLMRIVAVHPDRITLNTETSAWPNARGAINEMRGDLADIEWDEDEKIEIYRSELSQLVANKKIVDARRG